MIELHWARAEPNWRNWWPINFAGLVRPLKNVPWMHMHKLIKRNPIIYSKLKKTLGIFSLTSCRISQTIILPVVLWGLAPKPWMRSYSHKAERNQRTGSGAEATPYPRKLWARPSFDGEYSSSAALCIHTLYHLFAHAVTYKYMFWCSRLWIAALETPAWYILDTWAVIFRVKL